MKRTFIVTSILAASAGCMAIDSETGVDVEEEITLEAEQALANGFAVSPTEARVAKLNGNSCTATVIDPWWAITARHCLPKDGEARDKDPHRLTLKLGAQTRHVTHVALHPDHLERVDVMMLRLDAPFTNIPQTEIPLYSGDTDDLVGKSVLCTGYGGTGEQLTSALFTVLADTEYGEPNRFYLLQDPNVLNQSLVPGDSGSSCRLGSAAGNPITGVHKGAGQVSAEAWAEWATDRRDCPGFDPNDPATGFCSAACPCDVGEGDCDSNDQCQPGLYCKLAGADFGLPASYSVCDRIDPPTCGAFSTANPDPNFCRWSEDEICACNHGEGDCDEDHDCGGSLECQHDSGYAVGLPSTWEICVYPAAPGCKSYDPLVDDTEFCSVTCPCDLGQGDCDNDDQCRGGLICKSNVGAQFGKPADWDMCVRP